MRGAYPFYIISSFFLMSYFYWFAPSDYILTWGNTYLATFILKFLLTFLLVFMLPCHTERIDGVEQYIRECRMDLQRFRCP